MAMTDGAHQLPVRVYYEDTDAGGIVYHTAYLRFAERGRTEYLRRAGFDHQNLRRETGGGFVVRHMEIDYRSAARLDDELVVSTRFTETSGASARMEQCVMRGADTLVTLAVQLAFLGDDGRPKRLPDAVRQAFLALT
jgi:acyl-CoA thioester hydrolase